MVCPGPLSAVGSPLYLEIFCDAQIHLAGDERVRGDCCVEVFQLC